ncbi:NUDIX domain-containing protein [Mycolicibacterium moriokaense]|nr:NUDIX domain-containing protein [Mycolicibacterium moriokaense]
MPDGVVSRQRVAAYVIRQRGPRSSELLVFEQAGTPDAGTQVPAGGIVAGESAEGAVVREVAEETGLIGVAIRSRVHTEDKPHPVTGQPRSTTFFVLDAPADAQDAWSHTVSGRDADAGLIFHCRFVALPLQVPLADGQDTWLGLVDPTFATTPAARTRCAEVLRSRHLQ